MTDILESEDRFTIKKLEAVISRKDDEIQKLKFLLKESGFDDNIDISDEEIIAVKQLQLLKQISDGDDPLSTSDIKNFDILVKNLRLIRGKVKRGKSNKLDNMSSDTLKELLEN
jgi:hypothetical protein